MLFATHIYYGKVYVQVNFSIELFHLYSANKNTYYNTITLFIYSRIKLFVRYMYCNIFSSSFLCIFIIVSLGMIFHFDVQSRIFCFMVCAVYALFQNSSPKEFLLCFHLEVLALYIRPTETF